FVEVEQMPGKRNLGKTMQLFHAKKKLLVQCLAQDGLRVHSGPGARRKSYDRHRCMRRRRARQLQHLNSAVARDGQRNWLQLHIDRKIEREAEVPVGVAGGGEISLVGIKLLRSLRSRPRSLP